MPLCFPDGLYYFASQPTDSRNSRYDPKLTIIAALFVCIDHLAHDPPIHSSPKWCIHNSMRVAGGSVLMLCWSVDCGWACGEKLKRGSTRAAWYYWGLKNIGLICLRFHPHRRRAIAACIIFRGFFSYSSSAAYRCCSLSSSATFPARLSGPLPRGGDREGVTAGGNRRSSWSGATTKGSLPCRGLIGCSSYGCWPGGGWFSGW